jgi:predicted outer membrane repeat protein
MFSLTLQGFTIQNFKNRGDGGAIHLVNSTLIVKNCIFKMNFANSYGNGGAIYATKQSKLLVEDSIFLGHRARGSGGIVFSNGGSLLVIERSVLEGIAIDNCWSST